jgi:hypothetical protein
MALMRKAGWISLLALPFFSLIAGPDIAPAQSGSAIALPDGFTNLSVTALLATSPDDRRGARAMFWEQVALLPPNARMQVTGSLVKMLKAASEQRQKIEIAATLGSAGVPWMTPTLNADVTWIYSAYRQTNNENMKAMLDYALQNAAGLYRDGIHDYNTDKLARVAQAPAKLAAMADKFPKSRYAENASFYVGPALVKTYLFKDSRGIALINDANAAFERYIKRTENDEFTKREYLAGGYFFRALDGLITGNVAETKDWLNRGLSKFTDNDKIYIYQLFPSADPALVLDDFLPAHKVFATTLSFLNAHPNASDKDQTQLLAAIRTIR